MSPEPDARDRTYRALLDLAPVPVFVDRAGKILYANAAGARLLGADDPTELEGASVLRFVAAEEEAEVRRRIRLVEGEGRPSTVQDLRLVREDGEERMGSIRAIPVTFGGAAASLSIIKDVTEERRARRALQQSERRFRSLFEDSHDAVYRTTRDGRIVQANRAMCELFGLGPDEMGDVDVRALYANPEDRQRFRREIEASGFVQDFQVRLRRKDGEERICVLSATPWRNTDGELAGYQGIIRDVTERRRLEEALRVREERYRRLVEAVGVVPWELRVSDWTFTYVAPQVEEIFGYPRDAWLEPGFWPEHLHPDDREEAVRFCATQTRRGRDHEFEYRFRHGDGHAVWIHDIVTVVDDGGPGDPANLLRGVMIDITDRKRFERQLEEQALRDELTGLPNRTLFWDRLEHALARCEREGSSGLAVLFVDLDRFKRVNDSLGHAAGDQVLVEVAGRLDEAFRDEDTVARFGGDEFAVILEDAADQETAVEAARRFLRGLEEPIQVEGEPLRVDASVGIAVTGPETDGWVGPGGADELIRRADRAMFRAKDRPTRVVPVLGSEEDGGRGEQLRRERELREGIEREEFHPAYQSVVRLEDGRVAGVEVLARWHHPERGEVRPSEFIPLAEETGLILPLGRTLLEEACRTMACWTADGLASPETFLCVNLSARQFDDPDLVRTVEAILQRTALPPERLWFEVTERLVMRGYDRVEEVRALGVHIAVDDFGTGYSSLHYLKRLKVDALKIDRSFVDGVAEDYRDAAIVRTIVTLGRTLDLEVIAEGIERDDQRRAVLDFGCRLGQGYHFDRPMEAGSFAARLCGGDDAAV